MSTDASLATKQPAHLVLQEKFEALDKFAAENSVTTLLAGDTVGAFALTLKMSSAMEQLRSMITPEMMKPIMALQGSALGFRTDKDKEGGYKEEVVKEVLIEATLKGFRMVSNESNIIGGRFYAARDGFERIFRDLGKSGRLTDLRLSPGIPKTQADGAIVDYSASWTFKNAKGDLIKDELKLQIPIRVNSGQGPDAVLGKAKRKILAAIYSRITGTEITDGDVEDPRTIDVTASAPKTAGAEHAALPADVLAELEKLINTPERVDLANKYLIGNGTIPTGKTWKDIGEGMARRILKQTGSFLTAIGAK
jgi:hypothetical protein